MNEKLFNLTCQIYLSPLVMGLEFNMYFPGKTCTFHTKDAGKQLLFVKKGNFEVKNTGHHAVSFQLILRFSLYP